MNDEPTESDQGTPDRGMASWQRWALTVAGVLLVIVGVVWLLNDNDEPIVPPPAQTTSSTTTTTAEATSPDLPIGTYEVATVKPEFETVHVRSQPPAEWDDLETDAIRSEEPLPPLSQESASERKALPSQDQPIQGRHVAIGGWTFASPGPFPEAPEPFTMLVHERRGNWAEVSVPVRPNNQLGWVSLDMVEISEIQARVDIYLEDTTLIARNGDGLEVKVTAVIGTDYSPTPTGLFYLTDTLPQSNTSGTYGPYILALNSYSEEMDEFDSGVPVIAIHGTNRPELLGERRSNGCIRITNDVITKLAESLPLGTPVFIWPGSSADAEA